VPRPSSPLGAKASTRCPSRAAPAPSPKHAHRACLAEIRCQRSEVRQEGRNARAFRLVSDLCFLTSGTQAPPRRCSRIGSTYPCPGPISPRGAMTGPASRSRLASRFPENRGQRTDDRPHGPPRPLPVATRGPMPEDAPRDVCPSGRCPRAGPLFSAFWHLSLVGLGRLERPTSRLSGVRSDQLSYRPMIRDQRTEIRRQTRRSGVSHAADVGSVL
jgi:hypothetical protein